MALSIRATESRIQDLVTEALADIAAVMVFASGRPVNMSLPSLTSESPEVAGDAPYKTIFLAGSRHTMREPLLLPTQTLARVFTALGDLSQERILR